MLVATPQPVPFTASANNKRGQYLCNASASIGISDAICQKTATFEQDACAGMLRDRVWNTPLVGKCGFNASTSEACSHFTDRCHDIIACGDGQKCLTRAASPIVGDTTATQCEAVCVSSYSYCRTSRATASATVDTGLDWGKITCGSDALELEQVLMVTLAPKSLSSVPPSSPSSPLAPPAPPLSPGSELAYYNALQTDTERLYGNLACWTDRLMGTRENPSDNAAWSVDGCGYPYRFTYQQSIDDGVMYLDQKRQRGRIVTYGEGGGDLDTRSAYGAWEPNTTNSAAWLMIQIDPLNTPYDLNATNPFRYVSSMMSDPQSYTKRFHVYCLRSDAPANYIDDFKTNFSLNKLPDDLNYLTETTSGVKRGWQELWSQRQKPHLFGLYGPVHQVVTPSSPYNMTQQAQKFLEQTVSNTKVECYNVLIVVPPRTETSGYPLHGDVQSLRVALHGGDWPAY